MRPDLVGLYGGPDQIMGVASGIAVVTGAFLMFWNRVLVTLGKIMNKFRTPADSDDHKASSGTQYGN